MPTNGDIPGHERINFSFYFPRLFVLQSHEPETRSLLFWLREPRDMRKNIFEKRILKLKYDSKEIQTINF